MPISAGSNVPDMRFGRNELSNSKVSLRNGEVPPSEWASKIKLTPEMNFLCNKEAIEALDQVKLIDNSLVLISPKVQSHNVKVYSDVETQEYNLEKSEECLHFRSASQAQFCADTSKVISDQLPETTSKPCEADLFTPQSVIPVSFPALVHGCLVTKRIPIASLPKDFLNQGQPGPRPSPWKTETKLKKNTRASKWAKPKDVQPRRGNPSLKTNAWASEPSGNQFVYNTNEQDIEIEGPAQLMDWDGNWLPAPFDWHNRASFMNRNFAAHLESWIQSSTNTVHKIDVGSYLSAGELGEIAPRSWVPETIDNRLLNIWWCEHITSPLVALETPPWWQLYLKKSNNILQTLVQPETIMDPDPESHDQVQVAPTAKLAAKYFDAKMFTTAKTDEDINLNHYPHSSIQRYAVPRHKFAPHLNIYIRPAKSEDMLQITSIYDYFILNTIFHPALEPFTTSKVRKRWKDIQAAKLPFLVAVLIPVNTPRRIKGPSKKPENIIGFCLADDYKDIEGMYRYTVELELFVAHEHRRLGVGRCLLDKMMNVLDRHHIQRGGYEFISNNRKYGPGGQRLVGSVLCNILYDARNNARLVGLEKWLLGWDFVKAGELSDIGNKKGVVINQAIFKKKTGNEIELWQL